MIGVYPLCEIGYLPHSAVLHQSHEVCPSSQRNPILYRSRQGIQSFPVLFDPLPPPPSPHLFLQILFFQVQPVSLFHVLKAHPYPAAYVYPRNLFPQFLLHPDPQNLLFRLLPPLHNPNSHP